MLRPLPPQEIIHRFNRDRTQFLTLGIVAGISVTLLLVSGAIAGLIPTIILSVLRIVLGVGAIGSIVGMLTLGHCPACHRNPSANHLDVWPARCQSCDVRLR
jgi:hypothetical protein